MLVVSFGADSLLRKEDKLVIAVCKLSWDSGMLSSALKELELDDDEGLELESPEDLEFLSFPVVKRELALLLSVFKLIKLTSF